MTAALTAADLRERVAELEDEREELQAQLAGMEGELSTALLTGADTAAIKRGMTKAQARLDELDAALRGAAGHIMQAEGAEEAEARRKAVAQYNAALAELPGLVDEFLSGLDHAATPALRLIGLVDLMRSLYGETIYPSGNGGPVKPVGYAGREVPTIITGMLERVRGRGSMTGHADRAAAELRRIASETQPLPAEVD